MAAFCNETFLDAIGQIIRSCSAAYHEGKTASGQYQMRMENSIIIDVYCDQITDNGGWLVCIAGYLIPT